MRRLELTIWAFLLSLAFYPGVFGFLAWISLVRPIIILTRLEGRSAFNAAYFFSFCFNLFTIYWVAMVTPPGMVAAVVIVAFYYTAILVGFNKLYRIRPLYGFLALPIFWAGLEYFRTLSEFAFPWSDLGYTQAHYLWILQIVSVISVHGLTLLIVAVNVLLAQVFRSAVAYERRLTAGLVSVAVVALLAAFGWIAMPMYPTDGKFNIALLQGSVPLEIKWSRDKEYSINLYDSLITTVADSNVSLYIWPETAAPCYLTHDSECRLALSDIARRSGGSHLLGALAAYPVGGTMRHFNACYQFDSLGHIDRQYEKVKLVPFSEHVPYQDYLPFLQKGALEKYLTFIDRWGVQWWSNFYPGDSLKLFSVDGVTYVSLICFEATFPEYVRQSILDGAQFIVGITNDTWFKRSLGVSMHSRIFITRCVENRSWGARAANSGLTYFVDSYGRIRQNLDLYEVKALTGRVRLLDEYSVFTRIGDIVGRVSFLITMIVLGIFSFIWLAQKTRIIRSLPPSSSSS